MTVERADILDYLNGALSALADEVNDADQDEDDGVEGYKLPIDAALRRLGVAKSALATASIDDAREEPAYALAHYYALERFWTTASKRIDTNTGQNFSVGRSQLFLHIKDLLERAAGTCALLGYPVVASDKTEAVTRSSVVSSSVPTRAAW